MGACGIPILGVKRLLGSPFWGHRDLWDPRFGATGTHMVTSGTPGTPILDLQEAMGPHFRAEGIHGSHRDAWDSHFGTAGTHETPISQPQAPMGAADTPGTPILELQAPTGATWTPVTAHF